MKHLADVFDCNVMGGWPLEIIWWLGTGPEPVQAQDVLKSNMQPERPWSMVVCDCCSPDSSFLLLWLIMGDV